MTEVTLFCLPHAGAGATFYRAWPVAPDLDLTLVALQPAGREERFADPLTSSVEETADDLLTQVRAQATTGRVALFGHSFGAVVGFELARRLCAAGDPLHHLFVSGSADPGEPLGRRSAGLDDDQFVARVEELAGYSHPALADPDMRELILPALRSDVDQHETYRAHRRTPLPVPVSAFRGADDELVDAAQADGWSAWTSGTFEYREFPGRHMYLADRAESVLQAVADACAYGKDRAESETAR